MKPTALCLLSLVLFAGPGCTYYQVHDPHSGKTYYTHNWDSKGVESGVIVFKDAATGSKVTLANHEVRKIKEREFKAGVRQQTPAEPR